jgi:hypothetical protein
MTNKTIIQDWVNDAAMDLIKNYDKLKLRASGKFARDLETKIENEGSNWKIKFLSSSHSYFMLKGRAKNKNQTKEGLKAWVGWAGSTFLADWVRDKGVKASPFAVAYKIARSGINVPNRFNRGTLISDVFTEKRVGDLLNSLRDQTLSQVKVDLKQTLQKA